MEMSMVEVTARANFLIYEYIRTTLRCTELARLFKEAIQGSIHKDIIVFKGLEDLTTILMKHYRSQVPAADPVACDGSENVSHPLSDSVNGGNGQQKRKKKNKQKHSEPEEAAAATEPAEVAEPAAAAPAQEAEEPATERKKKKKKKRSQVEMEAEPEAANGQTAETEAVEAEVAAAAPAEDGEVPRKKHKKQHKTDADADAAPESADVGDASIGRSQPDDEDQPDEKLTADEAANGGSRRHKRQGGQPYRRVREEEVVNKHFQDNSFEAKLGAATGWGYKANEDLKPTQGRSFRHEKTKKKRGSYKGGAIDTGVSSFKFESDSE